MKAISFIKKNAMLLLAGAAIIGFSSFKLIKSTDDIIWFETDEFGEILDVTDGQSNSPNGCLSQSTTKYCALGFSESDLVGGTDAPVSGLADPNASMYTIEKHYRQNN